MPDTGTYQNPGPTRAETDSLSGTTVLEFGTDWCGYCRAAQPLIAQALQARGGALRHLKIEDGSGRPLGRSFRVKLWPTLIVLHDGQEIARSVRPDSVAAITEVLAAAPAG
ncbi:thioredoxin family protein [Xylophilus sp. GOD-11R]|uniref:thioredoxin family protein n=1 Tax=Xylophilus sp. GOD-11R TaxID=3089814 RepID=UPI00298D03AF|nr:thioredoxin family protein [Xylophilus sp. GOD-11R]WPB56105.1 thioredoxin family protein [Xylophilus sp. GOD-11R]